MGIMPIIFFNTNKLRKLENCTEKKTLQKESMVVTLLLVKENVFCDLHFKKKKRKGDYYDAA